MKSYHRSSVRVQVQAREKARAEERRQRGVPAFKRRLSLNREFRLMDAALNKAMRYPTLYVNLDQFCRAFPGEIGAVEDVAIVSAVDVDR